MSVATWISIGALVVAIVGFIYTWKVDRRTTGISDEQRKQDVLNILREAGMSIMRAKAIREGIAPHVARLIPEAAKKAEDALAVIETQSQIVEELRATLNQAINRLQLEITHERALDLKALLKTMEANAEEVFEMLKVKWSPNSRQLVKRESRSSNNRYGGAGDEADAQEAQPSIQGQALAALEGKETIA